MDWALILSMPLMLLLGFIGDAASRDEDEDDEVGQANPAEADLAVSQDQDVMHEEADGLSAMMAASEEEEAEEGDAPMAEADPEQTEPEADAAEAEGQAETEDSSEETAAAEQDSPADQSAPVEVADFDPEEDVLIFEAPGAAGAEVETEQTADGLLVRLAGQEALLPGITELPPDAVQGVEPSPSA